jgi:hypothetical protein
MVIVLLRYTADLMTPSAGAEGRGLQDHPIADQRNT